MSKRKRILIWIGSFLAALVLFLYFFGSQIAFALMAWNTGRKIPEVKDVPISIEDSSINQTHGTKFSYPAYSFEIPWTDIDQSKSKQSDTKQILAFESGIHVLVTSVPPREFVGSIAQKEGGENILRQMYGEQVVSTDYAFYRAMLNATPHTVNPFGSREAAVRSSMLLVIKAIAMPAPAESGMYSLHTAGFQGFQYGAPGNSRRFVISDLFDDNGGFEFIFMEAKGQTPRISQEDINRVTQSLVRLSPASVHPVKSSDIRQAVPAP